MVGAQQLQQRVKIVGGKRIIVAVVDSAMMHRTDSLHRADSLFKMDSLLQGGTMVDSLKGKGAEYDSAALLTNVNDNLRKEKKGSKELAMLNEGLAQRSRKFSLTRDTISPGALVGLSLIPGLGQVYNKQYLKAPLFLAAGGAFLAGGVIYGGKFKQAKNEWQNAVNLALPREQIEPLQKRMIQAESSTTIFYSLAAATYLYQLADATYNYRGYDNPVRTATILAALFPGAGFVYTKVYWRLPIYYGGFAVLATVVDYNARNFDRYNSAYLAVADGDPNTRDEFNGRYSAEVLKNAKDGYRRNRDFGIICLVGAYALSIIDTFVIASLKNWDVSSDLSIRVEPTMFEEQIYRGSTPRPQAAGMSLKIMF